MRAPNTDFVIYFAGNAPPAAPDVAGVRGGLYDHFRQGMEVSENPTHAHRYTATLDVPLQTDIRDGYPGADEYRVYVPDQDGQGYRVVFVEQIRHFRGKNFKRVFLDKLPLVGPKCGAFALPNVLYATIPIGTGCPCLDGLSQALTFDGVDTWVGYEQETVCAFTTPDGTTYSTIRLMLQKVPVNSTDCHAFHLTVEFSDHGDAIGPSTPSGGPMPPTTCFCNPPYFEYADIFFTDPGGACAGGIAVVITT